MIKLGRRSPRLAGQMKYVVGRYVLENAIESRRVPGRLLQDDVRRIDGLPATERPDIDAAPTKRLDEMSSNEALPTGYDGATHGLKMRRDLPRTSSGQARSRPAARYRAKCNRPGSRPHCRCWL